MSLTVPSVDDFVTAHTAHIDEYEKDDQFFTGHALAVSFLQLMHILKEVIMIIGSVEPKDMEYTFTMNEKKFTITKENAIEFHKKAHQHITEILKNPYFQVYMHNLYKDRRNKRKETVTNLDTFVKKLEKVCSSSEKK